MLLNCRRRIDRFRCRRHNVNEPLNSAQHSHIVDDNRFMFHGIVFCCCWRSSGSSKRRRNVLWLCVICSWSQWQVKRRKKKSAEEKFLLTWCFCLSFFFCRSSVADGAHSLHVNARVWIPRFSHFLPRILLFGFTLLLCAVRRQRHRMDALCAFVWIGSFSFVSSPKLNNKGFPCSINEKSKRAIKATTENERQAKKWRQRRVNNRLLRKFPLLTSFLSPCFALESLLSFEQKRDESIANKFNYFLYLARRTAFVAHWFIGQFLFIEMFVRFPHHARSYFLFWPDTISIACWARRDDKKRENVNSLRLFGRLIPPATKDKFKIFNLPLVVEKYARTQSSFDSSHRRPHFFVSHF